MDTNSAGYKLIQVGTVFALIIVFKDYILYFQYLCYFISYLYKNRKINKYLIFNIINVINK